MDAALGMPEAMTSASCPGRIRDTLPYRTLLAYFVPSAVITMPSLTTGRHRLRRYALSE